MFVFVVGLALVAVCSAVPPVWFTGGQCGLSKYSDAGEQDLPGPTVVGGVQARQYEFPWQVSVRRKSSNAHFCGGIVINERWIITAAHCMEGETPGVVSIVVGDWQRSAASDVRQTLDVEAIYIHENYVDQVTEYYNDISVVKLATAIQLSENVWPICAPDPDNDYAYQKSQCSGWGTLYSGGPCCPDILQYVTMNITSNAHCHDFYDPRGYPITDDMICATDNQGSNQRDSCQGDSGGPLSVKDSNGIFSVVGVVSWGIGCASGYPGVYDRVGYEAAWVTEKIQL
jgi:trypsin